MYGSILNKKNRTNKKERISRMENGLSDIPQVERELMSIERLQSISENIYIFLLKVKVHSMSCHYF